MENKIVCVIGLGYIGLSTAALLSNNGYKVFGVDINQNTVDVINNGDVNIIEPDLDIFVRTAISNGNLSVFTKPKEADIYIICVPTPINFKDGIPHPDIESILAAVYNIINLLKPGDQIILESTSPVGTTEKIYEVIKSAGIDVTNISIAYCPERVLPGKIMKELVENDRIVGGLTIDSAKQIASFYRTFVCGKVIETDTRTAELCKLTENSFRDVNIAFANELSLICDKEGINVWNLIKLANLHPRVNILQPSPGVGGHCIAVDPWFIVARNANISKIIRSARDVNNFKTSWVIDKIKIAAADASARLLRKPKLACLGITFKPNIDDLRESPAMYIVETLVKDGYDVIAVEPNIEQHDRLRLSSLAYAIKNADVIAVLVKHQPFEDEYIRKKLRKLAALDFCGLLE